MSAGGYRLHPDATKELDAAGEWYDAQLLGLSLELFDAVEEAIALIPRDAPPTRYSFGPLIIEAARCDTSAAISSRTRAHSGFPCSLAK